MAKKIKNVSNRDKWLFGVKDNRYVMGYSQAEHSDMIVYAPTYEEALAKFENGEYITEEQDF